MSLEFLPPDNAIHMALDVVIVWCLLAIAVVDIRQMIIPDRLTLVVAIGAGLQLVNSDVYVLAEHGLGAAFAFVLFEGTRRMMTHLLQREAMGFGDVKLITAGGLWIGVYVLPYAILLACVGAVLAILLKVLIGGRDYWRETLPFGPFIACGLIMARILESWPNLLQDLF